MHLSGGKYLILMLERRRLCRKGLLCFNQSLGSQDRARALYSEILFSKLSHYFNLCQAIPFVTRGGPCGGGVVLFGFFMFWGFFKNNFLGGFGGGFFWGLVFCLFRFLFVCVFFCCF